MDVSVIASLSDKGEGSSSPSRQSPGSVLFDWAIELRRFSREVTFAEAFGAADELLLADMECSLDLLDAELLDRRARSMPLCEAEAHAAHRKRLCALISRLRSIAP